MDVGKCNKTVFEEILCTGPAGDCLLCDRDAFGDQIERENYDLQGHQKAWKNESQFHPSFSVSMASI